MLGDGPGAVEAFRRALALAPDDPRAVGGLGEALVSVLDEQGAVRHHVAIFVDGQAIRDKRDLAVPLAPAAEVYIMQALSGG